ncbi:hypothetical protein AB0I66_00165 [Streptomyces sp. NPDC050439]|uniref:hypothetical protein n=1 Tax=unclassified Streptomyces TaxID=2593676 RepID=UPI00343401BE
MSRRAGPRTPRRRTTVRRTPLVLALAVVCAVFLGVCAASGARCAPDGGGRGGVCARITGPAQGACERAGPAATRPQVQAPTGRWLLLPTAAALPAAVALRPWGWAKRW